MSWRKDLFDKVDGLNRFVLITVIEVSGSAPREVGARMVVSEKSISGSIGGGNLEYKAIQSAKELLSHSGEFTRRTEFTGLGVTLKQCCGGAVQLMFELFSKKSAKRLIDALALEHSDRPRFLVSCVFGDHPARVVSRRDDLSQMPDAIWDSARSLITANSKTSQLVTDGKAQWFITYLDEQPTKIVLFGAGHVGKSLVKLLQDLPFQIDWVDSRVDIFPTTVPDNTRVVNSKDPMKLIDNQPEDVFFVVMTHDHGLDYELCLHILRRRKFAWLGLIGSKTKRMRFEQRLEKDSIDSFTLQRLVCPIGIPGIRGKFPAVIALSTAAQLLEVRNHAVSAFSDNTLLQVEAQS